MHKEQVQTKRQIEQTLRDAGINPLRRFGQNFLIDGNLMRRLVDAAEVGSGETVLEVGGGTGGLTDLLAARAGCVCCVEIDRGLSAILADRFAEVRNVRLIVGDVLESKHRLSSEVGKFIQESPESGVILVSNLPYQIATPLLMILLQEYPAVSRFCFAVQKEVGERLLAVPGTKAYGPLSILSQLLGDVELVTRLPPQAFWPRPAVDSVMMKVTRKQPAPMEADTIARFASFVRGAFNYRRKTLRVALRQSAGEKAWGRMESSVDGSRRPESFSIGEWCDMFDAIER